MANYTRVRVTEDVKSRLDADQRENETRNEQIIRLLDGEDGASDGASQAQFNLEDIENAAKRGAADAINSARR